MLKERESGILLPIRSLPSKFGIGDMGPAALSFADFLYHSGQKVWQVLPCSLSHPIGSYSPYNSVSAFAGNTLLISPELLVEQGFISEKDLSCEVSFSEGTIDFPAVISYKERILSLAYQSFQDKGLYKDDFEQFCCQNTDWLDDCALFLALRVHFHNSPWCEWPEDIRFREEKALKGFCRQLSEEINKEKFFQFLFYRQWLGLKKSCHERGIQLFGDMPIYVDYESVDVWSHSGIFKLDADKKRLALSGAPPDYFSETGQLWGNPVYDWDELKKSDYDWWVKRIRHNLEFYDLLRIDHFRGFVAYWEVAAGEKTAMKGKWVKVPAEDFFQKLLREFPGLPIIAEDLGHITQDVRDIMKQFGFPGMKVLLFAFNDDTAENPYVPHQHKRNCVIYTGTHDNNTVRGWFDSEASDKAKNNLFRYLGHEILPDRVHKEFLRMAMMSVARLIIIPMQDILGLGKECRINKPATIEDNWLWRLRPEQINDPVAQELAENMQIYGRTKISK